MTDFEREHGGATERSASGGDREAIRARGLTDTDDAGGGGDFTGDESGPLSGVRDPDELAGPTGAGGVATGSTGTTIGSAGGERTTGEGERTAE